MADFFLLKVDLKSFVWQIGSELIRRSNRDEYPDFFLRKSMQRINNLQISSENVPSLNSDC